jgi:hypothetical protein
VRSGYERPALLLIVVGILAYWLPTPVRVAWALFGAVAMLSAYAVEVARRPSFLLTEAGDYLLTESDDRFILE